MKVDDLPAFGGIVDAGPDDRVFDGLLLAGPLVIGLVSVLGRTALTRVVAGTYVVVFVIYVLYRGVSTV